MTFQAPVVSSVFSPGGTQLFVALADGTLSLRPILRQRGTVDYLRWSNGGYRIHETRFASSRVHALEIGETTNQAFAALHTGQVVQWDAPNGRLRLIAQTQFGAFTKLAYAEDRNLLFAGTNHGRVVAIETSRNLINAANSQLRYSQRLRWSHRFRSPVISLRVLQGTSPTRVLVTLADGTARVIHRSAATGEIIEERITGSATRPSIAAFADVSPSGDEFLVVERFPDHPNTNVHVFRYSSGGEIRRDREISYPIALDQVRFLEGGHHWVSLSHDRVVREHEARTGYALQTVFDAAPGLTSLNLFVSRDRLSLGVFTFLPSGFHLFEIPRTSPGDSMFPPPLPPRRRVR